MLMLRVAGNAKLNKTYTMFTASINEININKGLVFKHFTDSKNLPSDINFNTYAITLLEQRKKHLQNLFNEFKAEMDTFNGIELSKDMKRLLIANVWELVSFKNKSIKNLRANIDRHVSYLQLK